MRSDNRRVIFWSGQTIVRCENRDLDSLKRHNYLLIVLDIAAQTSCYGEPTEFLSHTMTPVGVVRYHTLNSMGNSHGREYMDRPAGCHTNIMINRAEC